MATVIIKTDLFYYVFIFQNTILVISEMWGFLTQIPNVVKYYEPDNIVTMFSDLLSIVDFEQGTLWRG